MGILIYKISKDKIREIKKSTELQSQVNDLNRTIIELQEKKMKCQKQLIQKLIHN